MFSILNKRADSYLLIMLFQYNMLETIGKIRIFIESTIRCHKEELFAIRIDFYDSIILDGGGIGRIAKIGTEFIAVKTIQSIIGTHPNETILILYDTSNQATRHVVGCIKSSRVGIRKASQHLHEAKNSKK